MHFNARPGLLVCFYFEVIIMMARTRKQYGSGGMISRATGMLWPTAPANVPPANEPPANEPLSDTAEENNENENANEPLANEPLSDTAEENNENENDWSIKYYDWSKYFSNVPSNVLSNIEERYLNDVDLPINGTPYDILNWMKLSHRVDFVKIAPIIQNMIANGADINETRNGLPLLHLVFEFLSRLRYFGPKWNTNAIISIIRELLNRGVDIDSVDGNGRTLLDKALSGRFFYFSDYIALLLSLGATITAEQIIKFEYPDVTLFLLNSAPESVLNTLRNYTDSTGGNLFHYYIQDHIRDPYPIYNTTHDDYRSDFNPRLMHLNAHRKYKKNEIRKIIKKLLEIGINPEAKNAVGQTPARLAMIMGFPDIAEMLTVHQERSPNNRKTRNIYGMSNATFRRLKENQTAKRAAAGVGGRRRRTRRRQLRRS